MISRNNIELFKEKKYKDGINSPKEYSIKEIIRIKLNYEDKYVPIKVNNHFPKTKKELFTQYLDSFYSNISIINNLPYYLIPLTTCLRFFLIEKIKTNLFICDETDTTYRNFIQFYKEKSQDSKKEKIDEDDEEPKTPLHSFEFESLLASCVAALTFTFLNVKCYYATKENNKSPSKNKSLNSTKKREKNIYSDCHNLFYSLNVNNKRSLDLKNKWGIENFQKDIELYGNSVQIFAEFLSVLYINIQFLEALRITDYDSKYVAFSSMYHYQWEESYYSMIESFKLKNDVFHIFNTTFTKNKPDYISFLQKTYSKIFNAILYLS